MHSTVFNALVVVVVIVIRYFFLYSFICSFELNRVEWWWVNIFTFRPSREKGIPNFVGTRIKRTRKFKYVSHIYIVLKIKQWTVQCMDTIASEGVRAQAKKLVRSELGERTRVLERQHQVDDQLSLYVRENVCFLDYSVQSLLTIKFVRV